MDPEDFFAYPEKCVQENSDSCLLRPFPIFLNQQVFEIFSKFPNNPCLADHLEIVQDPWVLSTDKVTCYTFVKQLAKSLAVYFDMMQERVSEQFFSRVILTERVLSNFCLGVMRVKPQEKPWFVLETRSMDITRSVSWLWKKPN